MVRMLCINLACASEVCYSLIFLISAFITFLSVSSLVDGDTSFPELHFLRSWTSRPLLLLYRPIPELSFPAMDIRNIVMVSTLV